MLFIFLTSVAGCGVGGYYISRSEQVMEFLQNLRPQDKPLEVRIGGVEKGKLVRTVNSPGAIEPKTKVQISAQVSARITALPFREGDTVKTGDVVVKLDSRDLAASLESAQASQKSEEARLEGAKASLARAEQELTRQRELSKNGDSARSVLENAESEFLRAKSQAEASTHAIEIARANISRAQKDLENAEIRAPFNGIITKLNAEVGELVVVGTLNNAGSVIMEIADLNVMLLKARVDESNVAPIKAGQKAKVFINAFRGRTFEGTVDRVGLKRQVDRDGTGYYEVEILVKKPEDQLLYSGLTANCDIEVETFYDILKVPSQAVVDRKLDDLPKELVDGNPFIDRTKAFARVVYQIVDGKAKATPVAVGTSDLTHTILTGGVEENQQIVVGPFKVLGDLREGRKLADEMLSKKNIEAAKAKAAAEEKAASAGGKGAGAPEKAEDKKPETQAAQAGEAKPGAASGPAPEKSGK